MKRFLLLIPVVMAVMLYAESHASAQRLQWVQNQNARTVSDIRFAAEGDTLVIYDANINWAAWSVNTVATQPQYSVPIRRAGFRFVRAGQFKEQIQ